MDGRIDESVTQTVTADTRVCEAAIPEDEDEDEDGMRIDPFQYSRH